GGHRALPHVEGSQGRRRGPRQQDLRRGGPQERLQGLREEGGLMALIELKDIHKVYDMGAEKVHALNGVDLQVEKGEYVAVMGSSGSGKSTLINLVGCLD